MRKAHAIVYSSCDWPCLVHEIETTVCYQPGSMHHMSASLLCAPPLRGGWCSRSLLWGWN